MNPRSKAGQPSGSRKGRKTIFILEDHPTTRRAIAALINQEAYLDVCEQAGTVKRALATLKTIKPDLILTDLTMRGQGGLEFIKEMKLLYPEIPVLVLSMHDKGRYAERALRAGAKGYVMKSAGGEELIRAIRRILRH